MDDDLTGQPGPAELIEPGAGLPALARAAQLCRGCDLWRDATQAVFGAGSEHAAVVLVGEQPGDAEDREGHPFVGPAGGLLRRCLAEAGLPEDQVWMTNVVKHFRWTTAPGKGRRRIHRRPDLAEIHACTPWVEAELDRLRPAITVCLGAVAAQALIDPHFKVSTGRGRLLTGRFGTMLATVHPSSILRAPGDEARHAAQAAFVADLTVVAPHLGTVRPDWRLAGQPTE